MEMENGKLLSLDTQSTNRLIVVAARQIIALHAAETVQPCVWANCGIASL